MQESCTGALPAEAPVGNKVNMIVTVTGEIIILMKTDIGHVFFVCEEHSFSLKIAQLLSVL